MPPTNLTDDDVLRAMTKMGLDASNILTFRSARHFLEHELPPCCIIFNVLIALPLAEIERAVEEERIPHIEDEPPVQDFLEGLENWGKQVINNAKTKGITLHYVPCPACAISWNFHQRPVGFPVQLDAKKYPDPDDDSDSET